MIDYSSSLYVSILDPVIVTSPTIRSGTTLLQRLLCSSSNALIFGENCAQDLELLLGIYETKLFTYALRPHRSDRMMDRILNRQTEDWMIDLMPDPEGYSKALGKGCLMGIDHCRDEAAQAGRPVWGFKYPGLRPQTLRLIRKMLPQARLLFIYRDIEACLKSAKAWGAIPSEQALREFCRSWVENLGFALSLESDPQARVIDFRRLTQEPDALLPLIAAFTGANDLQPDVLNRRINTSARGTNEGYLPPAELSDPEIRVMEEMTAGLRSRLHL